MAAYNIWDIYVYGIGEDDSMITVALAGFLSGIISGMGIGGGAILIPILTVIVGMGQREAQFVNLAYFIPTAVAALFKHIKNNNVEKSVIKQIVVFGVVGSICGSAFAARADESFLRSMFGVFLGCMGIYEIIKGIRLKRKV